MEVRANKESRMSELDVAYLIQKDICYFAKRPGVMKGVPHSAVTDLIQGIHEQEPDQALAILRNRIFASHINEMNQGMIRVAAKSLSAFSYLEEKNLSELIPNVEKFVTLGPFSNPFSNPKKNSSGNNQARCLEVIGVKIKNCNLKEGMELAAHLAQGANKGERKYQSDRPIASLLLDEKGYVLQAGINTSSKNKTLHAEVNLVQNFYDRERRAIPKNSTIISTHKPCRMCAGMILFASEDYSSIKVVYQNPDGRLAKHTALDGLNILKQIDKNEFD